MESINGACAALSHAREEPAVTARQVGRPRFRTASRSAKGFDQHDQVSSIIHKPPFAMKISRSRTILISDAQRNALRQNHRMKYEALVRIIESRMREKKYSERKLMMLAGVGLKTLYHLKIREHAPKPENIRKIADALQLNPDSLLALAAQIDALQPSSEDVHLRSIHVKGAVQAGVWHEAVEWPASDWFSISVPADDRFNGVERFGLQVRGASMDRVYPDGTIVIVVRYGDIGRLPTPGERVVVLRRSHQSGEFEATLKEYEIDRQGRQVLWPRSTDPEFQTPFILSEGDLPLADGAESLPASVSAGAFRPHAGEPDIVIAGLVVGSYRPE